MGLSHPAVFKTAEINHSSIPLNYESLLSDSVSNKPKINTKEPFATMFTESNTNHSVVYIHPDRFKLHNNTSKIGRDGGIRTHKTEVYYVLSVARTANTTTSPQFKEHSCVHNLAGTAGLEPATGRLTAASSTN